jgi:hypothetical protein
VIHGLLYANGQVVWFVVGISYFIPGYSLETSIVNVGLCIDGGCFLNFLVSLNLV